MQIPLPQPLPPCQTSQIAWPKDIDGCLNQVVFGLVWGTNKRSFSHLKAYSQTKQILLENHIHPGLSYYLQKVCGIKQIFVNTRLQSESQEHTLQLLHFNVGMLSTFKHTTVLQLVVTLFYIGRHSYSIYNQICKQGWPGFNIRSRRWRWPPPSSISTPGRLPQSEQHQPHLPKRREV